MFATFCLHRLPPLPSSEGTSPSTAIASQRCFDGELSSVEEISQRGAEAFLGYGVSFYLPLLHILPYKLKIIYTLLLLLLLLIFIIIVYRICSFLF